MKFKAFWSILAVVVSLNLILPAVYAQFNFGNSQSLRPWVEFIVGNNQFPNEWLVFPNIIYYLILPFVAIVAVVYGIISDLRIFRYTKWVRGVIAVAMAGMTLPSGWLIQAVLYLYSFNAAFAALAFGVVFFIGVILWAAGTTLRMTFGQISEVQIAKSTTNVISDINNQIRKNEADIDGLMRDPNYSNDKGKQDQVMKLEDENRRLRARIPALKTAGYG